MPFKMATLKRHVDSDDKLGWQITTSGATPLLNKIMGEQNVTPGQKN